jgi:SAM-dependent methyltransferase
MGADVTGIDLYTKKAEEFLRKMNDPPTTARCRLVEHDLEIPIAEFIQNKFDLIYCNGIIHHTRNPPAICRNLRSYLADNGRLLLGVYGVGGLFWHKVSVLRALARLLTSLGWTTTDVAGLFQRRNLVPIWNKRFKSEQGIESVVWTLENLLVPILRQYRPDEIEAVMRDSGLRPLTRYDSAQQKHFPLASYPTQGLWRRIRKGHGPLLYIAEGI